MSVRTFRRGNIVIAAAGATCILVSPPAPAASLSLITCQSFAYALSIDTANNVTGSGTFTGCQSLGQPGIHSGSLAISGRATLVTNTALTTTTTETITWNTGATTTTSVTREFIGTGSVVGTGTGLSTGGLFNPGAEADAATGTRQNPATLNPNDTGSEMTIYSNGETYSTAEISQI